MDTTPSIACSAGFILFKVLYMILVDFRPVADKILHDVYYFRPAGCTQLGDDDVVCTTSLLILVSIELQSILIGDIMCPSLKCILNFTLHVFIHIDLLPC